MTHLTIARLTDTRSFFWRFLREHFFLKISPTAIAYFGLFFGVFFGLILLSYFCWVARAKGLIRITRERCQLELEG